MTGGVSPVPHEAQIHQGTTAGVVSRSVAGAIDVAVVGGLLLAAYLSWSVVLLVLDPRGFSFPRISLFLGANACFLAGTVYLSTTWALTGRSYGKQVMGLRLVAPDRPRVRPLVALVRAATCVLFPVGLFWAAVSTERRSVHDLFLHTSVIHDWTPRTTR